MENNLQELLENYDVPKLGKRDYWFVRTDSGTYYEDFVNNNYIAIGWDYLTIEKLTVNDNELENPEKLKQLISAREGKPIEENKDAYEEDWKEEYLKSIIVNKTEVTKILNKVKTFVYDIKIGDIVIIPSSHSNKISIGCVTSDIKENSQYIESYLGKLAMPEYTLCPFYKRREVKWYRTINKENLEIYLQNALKPQQAISPLNEYAAFIDRNIYDFYYKDDAIHSIVRTNQSNDMSLADLKTLIDLLYEVSTKPQNNEFSTLSPDDIKIKLNIHSPGIIELIYCGFSAIALSILFFGAYTIYKNGGKIAVKTKQGVEFSAETKGNAGNDIEKEKLKIVTDCLDSPDYKEKMKALRSLNLNVPDVYPVAQQLESKKNDEA